MCVSFFSFIEGRKRVSNKRKWTKQRVRVTSQYVSFKPWFYSASVNPLCATIRTCCQMQQCFFSNYIVIMLMHGANGGRWCSPIKSDVDVEVLLLYRFVYCAFRYWVYFICMCKSVKEQTHTHTHTKLVGVKQPQVFIKPNCFCIFLHFVWFWVTVC